MKCKFKPSDEPDVYICEVCDKPLKSKHPIEKLNRNCKSRGFGDTVKKVADATGVTWAAKQILGDCGCKERQERLNKMFPYKSSEEEKSV